MCNVRGLRIGDVGTYEAQALVIINYGTATAQEVLTFAEKITECVEKKCDIVIEKEVRIIV